MFVAAVSEASQAVTETRYIGHSIKRLEDQPLLTGAGNFVADLRFADMLEAAVAAFAVAILLLAPSR